MPPSHNLSIVLVGRGPLTLRQNNYITTGGEASIYRAGDTVVKVYTDSGKMMNDRMPEKIGILSKFNHRYIIAPAGLVTDRKQKPLGYYMPFATGEPFSRVFTTPFRQRIGFDDGHAIKLVHNMREVPIYAHAQGAVLGDANELNWLMLMLNEPEPRICDVDSWQIGTKWPLRVIMPSIRDYHTAGFNEQSDWFSWAVVSFQIFTGIHPYKGRHDGYKPGDLEHRMRDNVSVFHPDVHVNAAVRDFGCIPPRLRAWYEAVFERGERVEPPSPLDQTQVPAAARTLRQVVTARQGALVFEKLFDGTGDPVIRVFPSGVAMRASGELLDLASKRAFKIKVIPDTEIIKTDHGWLAASTGNLFVYMTLSDVTPLQFGGYAHGFMRSGNRLFAVTDQGLSEINLMELGRPLLTIEQTWETMPLATEWFAGVGVQNALGAKFLVLPFADKAVGYIRVPELDDVTVVTARAGYRFVAVVALDKSGEYKKFEFTFNREHDKYSVWTGPIEIPDLNLAILPNGVCATIMQDGELDIFVPQQGTLNRVQDRQIATDMQLSTWGDKVVYIQNGDVWWVRINPNANP